VDVLAHANLRYLDEKLDALQEKHALSSVVLFYIEFIIVRMEW